MSERNSRQISLEEVIVGVGNFVRKHVILEHNGQNIIVPLSAFTKAGIQFESVHESTPVDIEVIKNILEANVIFPSLN